MTVLPFQINEITNLYGRLSKLKPSAALEQAPGAPRDRVTLSAEAKTRLARDQARRETQNQDMQPGESA